MKASSIRPRAAASSADPHAHDGVGIERWLVFFEKNAGRMLLKFLSSMTYT